ncbi:rRNA pseudouridine synthase [Candidatus Gracilibacteria bacterium]|nr:rRNA pseudouridine synthase [Candidatus Gracilibacteria bacterium]
MNEKIRIHKYMSEAGICSRRKAEEYIKMGQVTVNGQPVTIGQKICPETDTVKLGDTAIQEQKNLVYYKIHKPKGILTTCAEHGDTNVIDIMNVSERIFPIGRLDKDSTGLLIMTNDGRLTNFLIHPRYSHEKEYIVETFSSLDDQALQRMRDGIYILGSYTKEADIKRLSPRRFSIILTEGRNRQIRRMVESVGGRVKTLKRVRIQNILLGNLKVGEYIPLSKKEKDILFQQIGLKK